MVNVTSQNRTVAGLVYCPGWDPREKIVPMILTIIPIIVLLTIVLILDFLWYQRRHRLSRYEKCVRENWDVFYRFEMGITDDDEEEPRVSRESLASINRLRHDSITDPLLSPLTKWGMLHDVTDVCDICEIEKPRTSSMSRTLAKSVNDVNELSVDRKAVELTSNNNLPEPSANMYRTSST